MEGIVFGIWTAVAFGIQLILCFVLKRRWLRLLPLMIQVALPLLCTGAYIMSEGNWAWLILVILLMSPLAAVGAAWVVYGLVRILQKIIK